MLLNQIITRKILYPCFLNGYLKRPVQTGKETIYFLYRILFNILSGKEDFQEVNSCLSPVFAEVDELEQSGIEIDRIHYSVKW